LYISGAQCRVFGCRVLNTAANSNGIAVFLAVGTVVARCYLNTTSSAAIGNQNIAGGAWLGNVFDGGANGLAIAGSNPVLVYGNLFLGQAGDAVNAAGGTANIINNSVYGLASGGGNGFAWSTAPGTTCTIAGNYFERVTTASKYCINSTNTPSTLFVLVANGYFNCTAFANGLGDTPSFFDNGLLASSGFANAAGGDFSPTSVMKNVGWPGLFENTSIYRGYPDLGAVQAQTSAGGGTVVGSPFPGMSGLLSI
jgi:hypothetical protein